MAILAGALALVCGAVFALAQGEQPTPAEKQSATTIVLPPSPKALLPDEFDGWAATGPSKVMTDAAQADPANAAALKEYGFNAAVLANYKRDGDTLSMRALRFDDASGAYGAYTYYRQNGWPKEDIGTGAASDKNRVLFWQGTTVVDATFSRIGPMTAGELREIAQPVAGADRKPRDDSADPGQPAAGKPRRANDALRRGPGGLRGIRRRAAGVAGGLRQGRGSSDGQLLARSRARQR